MPEIDDELIARAVRWCAEAGRQAPPEDVRAALAPLSWDQLLAVRAWLADAPPARPLGPRALADLARGALPAVAAERERLGQYRGPEPAARSPLPAQPARAKRPRGPRRAPTPAAPLIRRARDRLAPSVPAPPPAHPPLDELLGSEGRAVLERLIREHGARRGPLLAAMGRRWRRADGGAPDDADLSRLLAEHGLARAFARRERDEILHALRAGGGDRRRAAASVGLATAEGLDGALARLGAAPQAEAIREASRRDLLKRATLTERARLLLFEEERLRDLGLLAQVESDLAARLPEHLRALRASGTEPLPIALGRSLSLGRGEALSLVRRLGLELPAGTDAPRPEKGPGPRKPGRGEHGRSIQPRSRPRPGPGARPGPGPGPGPRPGPRPGPGPGARPRSRTRGR